MLECGYASLEGLLRRRRPSSVRRRLSRVHLYNVRTPRRSGLAKAACHTHVMSPEAFHLQGWQWKFLSLWAEGC